jgi:hypothetical protein
LPGWIIGEANCPLSARTARATVSLLTQRMIEPV